MPLLSNFKRFLARVNSFNGSLEEGAMFVAKLGFSDVSPGLLLWFIVTSPACHIKVDLDNDYLGNQSDVSDASTATNHGPHKPATSLQGHIKIDLAVSLQHPCLVT